MEEFDIIIAGGGASGLCLALGLTSESFQDQSILILDKEIKSQNDHTWCFWDRGSSSFDDILSNSFSKIRFRSEWNDFTFDILPYEYKMLQADRFYEYINAEIGKQSHIQRRIEKITKVVQEKDYAGVYTEEGTYRTPQCFKSFLIPDKTLEPRYFVAQHFKGWFIETQEDCFQKDRATFMDFDINQYGETRFFYVLPTSTRTALIEIAIFSNKVMQPEAYDPLIKKYIQDRFPGVQYRILEKEFGVIPMTSYPFWHHNSSNIFHIGGAGGAIKPSSGYAFQRIQQHTEAIIQCLKLGKNLRTLNRFWRDRFFLYDKTLLDVLLDQGYSGAAVFDNLFKNNRPQQIFKFLDGNTSLLEEAKIFRKMPIWPFLRGFLRNTLR